MGKKIGIAICAVLLIGLAAAAFIYSKTTGEEQIENAGVSANAAKEPDTLKYLDTEYPIRKQLQSVLLIGTDSIEKYEEDPDGLKPFYNYNQADFMMLLVIDKDGKKIELIHLNRDSMADVPWLDVLGNYGGTEFEQLCKAFNSGSGGKDSCKNTVNAVSSFMFDIPIDAYIQIPMTAIPVLNDLVGGVPVLIRDDLTSVDPAFVQGSTVHLTGTQAEKFVRARSSLADDTNLSRMSRQRDYMESFQICARDTVNTDSEFIIKLLEKLSSFLQSDMTVQQISDLVDMMRQYDISPIRYVDGELLFGGEYYEFYVDKASQWELIRNIYCS